MSRCAVLLPAGGGRGERGALVVDQLVEPGDVVLDGLMVMLPEGAQVPVQPVVIVVV